MNFIIDIDIPFIKGVFEPFGNVKYLKGIDISHNDIKYADAIIIRTRTKCNEHLLDNTNVKIIATATIGLDHIDLSYCQSKGIKVVSSAGCNAGGVMQYVFTALYYLAKEKNFKLPPIKSDKKINLGVIGVGNVGSKVADFGEYLGFNVLRNDPIKEREQTIAFNNGNLNLSDFKDFYSLDYLLENSDIITLHVYLDDITKGFVNDDFLKKAKPGAIFINSSRGEVVNDNSLIKYFDKFSSVVLDVWNNEPNINLVLLAKADIATPHIAGYSYEGKVNGTQMAVRQVAHFLNIAQLKDFTIKPSSVNNNNFSFLSMLQDEIYTALLGIYPIFDDSTSLKEHYNNFELLRNNYNYRREFYVKLRTT